MNANDDADGANDIKDDDDHSVGGDDDDAYGWK